MQISNDEDMLTPEDIRRSNVQPAPRDETKVFIVKGLAAIDQRKGHGHAVQILGNSPADLIAQIDAAGIPRSSLYLVIPDENGAPDVSLSRREYHAFRELLGPDVPAGS